MVSPHISHLEVKETFLTRKLLGGQKGSDAKLPVDLFSGTYLGGEMRMHTWEDPEIYQIQTQNQANQNAWPKETRRNAP